MHEKGKWNSEFFYLTCLIFILDRLIKQIVAITGDFFIFNGVLSFAFSKNAGIAFNIPIPAIVSVPFTLAFFALVAFHLFNNRPRNSRSVIFFFSLIFLGGLSNLIDRIVYGYVIDYFTVHFFPRNFSFNLADLMIAAGVLALLFKKSQTSEDLQKVNQKTYNTIAKEFSLSRQKPLWEEVRAFRRYVKHGARVADIGCGDGRLLKLFDGMDVHYVGVDINEALLANARLRVANDANNAPQFIHASMTRLPFEPETFDLVFMIASLHHLGKSDQLNALSEARRVLKTGGMFFITVFNLLRLSFRDKTVWRYRAYPVVRTLWSGRPLYYYAFTARRLKRLCAKAGFEVREAFYAAHGERADWWNGRNLVVIGKR